jgi:hypothetical protein
MRAFCFFITFEENIKVQKSTLMILKARAPFAFLSIGLK